MQDKDLHNLLFDSECLSLDTLYQYKVGTLDARSSNLVERHLLECALCSEVFDSLDEVEMAQVDSVVSNVSARLADRIAKDKDREGIVMMTPPQNGTETPASTSTKRVFLPPALRKYAAAAAILFVLAGSFYVINNSIDPDQDNLAKNNVERSNEATPQQQKEKEKVAETKDIPTLKKEEADKESGKVAPEKKVDGQMIEDQVGRNQDIHQKYLEEQKNVSGGMVTSDNKEMVNSKNQPDPQSDLKVDSKLAVTDKTKTDDDRDMIFQEDLKTQKELKQPQTVTTIDPGAVAGKPNAQRTTETTTAFGFDTNVSGDELNRQSTNKNEMAGGLDWATDQSQKEETKKLDGATTGTSSDDLYEKTIDLEKATVTPQPLPANGINIATKDYKSLDSINTNGNSLAQRKGIQNERSNFNYSLDISENGGSRSDLDTAGYVINVPAGYQQLPASGSTGLAQNYLNSNTSSPTQLYSPDLDGSKAIITIPDSISTADSYTFTQNAVTLSNISVEPANKFHSTFESDRSGQEMEDASIGYSTDGVGLSSEAEKQQETVAMHSRKAKSRSHSDKRTVSNTTGGFKVSPAGNAAPSTSNAASNVEPVYTEAEVMPSFPGGPDSLQAYIDRKLYPKGTDKSRFHQTGTVEVGFVVLENGRFMSVKVERSLSPEADMAALQLVQQMPAWNPAKHGGIPVKVRYVLPITFK